VIRRASWSLPTALLALAAGAAAAPPTPLTWPEPQRAFFEDGPGLLLPAADREALLAMDETAREGWIADFLSRDPLPETPENELALGIDRRVRLAASEFLSATDVRSQLLFLNGRPKDRLVIDCGIVFEPLEIWSYPGGVGSDGMPTDRQLVVYRPGPGEAYRLWLPLDGKRALYTSFMEYWLEQWEELRGRIRAVRFDIQNCNEAVDVDKATGVPGLTGVRVKQIRPVDASPFLEPPKDLAPWAKKAAATEVGDPPSPLSFESFDVRFPSGDGQRIVARALLTVGEDAGYQVAEDGKPEVKLVVEGVLEQDGKPFEELRLRFHLPVPKPGEPAVLAIDQPLRPKAAFLLRLKVKDEVGGGEARLVKGFTVPAVASPEPSRQGLVGGELLPTTVQQGVDSLLLIPPPADVVVGLWRADTIVTGERIKRVAFLVDGKVQLARTSAPFSAEVRLERFPTEQVIRVEGYDEAGALVAADEVIVNLQRGGLAVRIAAPPKGSQSTGKTLAKAEVVVPDGRRIESVEFRINDQPVGSLAKPPWHFEVEVPAREEVVYLTVVATLDDGSHAEAVRYLKSPQFIEEIEVNLVELYVAVTDRAGELVRDAKETDFEVSEGGKRQQLAKFDLVDDLPLAVGVLLDTSGSMAGSLVETQKAAADFLTSVLTPKDRAFLVSFARRPRLDVPPTDDFGAVVNAINGLQAVGDTALHDALIQSLYYFRGLEGQRALILLSDGDDNVSYLKYEDALEYAARSGVAIYAIGLNLMGSEVGIRSKLDRLAKATGGRSFNARTDDLPGIYKLIEAELRHRYLLAYQSSASSGKGGFREVEVKVKIPGAKARTVQGYYR
jgi:VWFA-related protein